MDSFWNKSVPTLGFDLKSAALLLFLLEQESSVAGAEGLKEMFF